MRKHYQFIFFTFLIFIFASNVGNAQCMPDVEPPTFSPNHPLMQAINDGDEVYYQCGEQEAFFEDYLTVSDNCDTEPMVSFSKGVTVGDCSTDGYMVKVDYCWEATDNQGNMSSFCFTAIVVDEEKPQFDILPADLTIDLSIGEELPPVDILTATDECHGEMTVSIDLDLSYPPDSCGYTLLRIWSAEDPCGNQVTHTQTITAIDNCVTCQLQVDDVIVIPVSCQEGDGSIQIVASGQNGGIGFEWSPAISNSDFAENLFSNENYSVTLTDDFGCSVSVENILVGMDCVPVPDTFYLNMECGDDFVNLCLNTEELPGLPNITSVCLLPINGSLSANNDTCFTYQPIANFSGLDQVCLSICDDQGICDTAFFEITVEECPQQFPCVDIPQDTLFAQASDCGDEIKFCVEFPLGEILDYDFEVNGLPYSNNISICAFDTLLSYGFSAIPGNGMNGPYEIDSWFINGNDIGGGSFEDVFDLVDLMNMLDPNGNWALDTITFNISSFNTQSAYGQLTISQQVTGDLVMLNINSATAPTGSALYFPVGSHEVVMTHQEYGFCVDTFTAIIHCAETQVVYDEIELGQNGTFCPTNSLPGQAQNIEIICPSCASTFQNMNGECVDYQGLEVGVDEILILVCDEFGFCDSTWLIVTVFDTGLPLANLDNLSTNENTEIEINVLDNDFVNGNLTSLRILIDPIHGLAIVNSNQTITFYPDRGYCGLDAFAYEICNETGCDTSAVDIEVICTQPVVFNGFSPNEDGVNDYFKISNLEYYPSHELQVFNRWGTQVFSQSGYKSDWDGMDLSGKKLPDGTYFYLLDLGNGDRMKGYVQIHR